MDDEAQSVYGRADHRDFARAGGRCEDGDVCRKHGISGATFYKWKAKFGGMDVSEARRLKSLEDENSKLKKLLAEAMLDNAMLKEIASKKW
jgi:putative transposase